MSSQQRVIFDRRFPHRTCVDATTRLESDPREAQAMDMAIEEIEIFPEKTEILVKRIQCTHDMRSGLWRIYQRSFLEEESPDYGLDEDEIQPADQIELGPAEEDTLNCQAKVLSLTDFKVTTGPGNAITVTSSSNTMTSDPDLRYVVYAPFLHCLGGVHITLEITARAFTSAIVSHLPAGKTVHFEFHKPPDTSFASIISFHRDLLRARPEMSVGALHNIPQLDGAAVTNLSRIYPHARSERHPLQLLLFMEPYKVFAVVLDKPDFINQAGVLFVMADGGRYRQLPGDVHGVGGGPDSDYFEMQVWRSAGVAEAARGLGMLALEKLAGST